ncbi:MAG TPA: hypothetical protein VE476_03090 [Propionibacteriaceae bacterium]|nr:hypothetical protein [Propionibacteriaceae bacterium]
MAYHATFGGTAVSFDDEAELQRFEVEDASAGAVGSGPGLARNVRRRDRRGRRAVADQSGPDGARSPTQASGRDAVLGQPLGRAEPAVPGAAVPVRRTDRGGLRAPASSPDPGDEVLDMAEKKIWDKKNPKTKSKKSTPSEKASAKKRAKKQGRSKPSLVDNINAQKHTGSKGSKKGRSKGKK